MIYLPQNCSSLLSPQSPLSSHRQSLWMLFPFLHRNTERYGTNNAYMNIMWNNYGDFIFFNIRVIWDGTQRHVTFLPCAISSIFTIFWNICTCCPLTAITQEILNTITFVVRITGNLCGCERSMPTDKSASAMKIWIILICFCKKLWR